MASYALLDQPEEETLHKSRLLNVEERPFKRISKRLLDPEKSLISTLPTLPPTPPPDASAADEEAAAHEKDKQNELEKFRQWKEDALLDFAGFESSIIRIQLLLTSNEKERERYAAEKLNIQANAQSVRENTAELRVQLEGAQRILAQRKEYDERAEKILSNRILKSREEQRVNIERLKAEIEDLESESQDYSKTWNRRKEQFDKIIDQTTEMQQQIKGEKEEAERREGMEEDDDEQRGGMSGNATPRPDSGGDTPMHNEAKDPEVSTPVGLTVGAQNTTRTRSPLRESQLVDEVEERTERDDEDMAEDGEVSAEADGIKADPSEGLITEEKEEGEEDDPTAEEQMDVT